MTIGPMRKAAAAAALIALVACAGPNVAPSGPRIARSAGGRLLTDADGMTLYIYDGDSPGHSNCTGVCALIWPPAKAATGARPHGAFSLIARDDGSRQWAYKGAPLYGYASDTKPGDTTGDGSEGTWHVARP